MLQERRQGEEVITIERGNDWRRLMATWSVDHQLVCRDVFHTTQPNRKCRPEIASCLRGQVAEEFSLSFRLLARAKAQPAGWLASSGLRGELQKQARHIVTSQNSLT